MANLPTWEDVRARFQQGAVEHPHVSADWDARQGQWTFSRSETDHNPEEASAESISLFKETARQAIRLVGKLNEPLPPYHVWLDLLRNEKRGLQRTPQFLYARDFRRFMESDGSMDVSNVPIIRQTDRISHVFKESAEFCEDLAARTFEPDLGTTRGKLPAGPSAKVRAGEAEPNQSSDTALAIPLGTVANGDSAPESKTGGRPFPERAVWLTKRLQERSWNKHDVSRQCGPHHKTVQKILDGKKVREDVLGKLAVALSAAAVSKDLPKTTVALPDIPSD